MPQTRRQLHIDKTYLRQFLDQELAKRGKNGRALSRADFASLVGVSQDTINEVYNNDKSAPSLEFLLKLSEATGTGVDAIIAIAYPAYAERFKVDPAIVLLVKELEGLSEAEQSFILNAIRGLKSNRVSNEKNKSG
jgi:transcriptional regulator with XRE-family HTH domain